MQQYIVLLILRFRESKMGLIANAVLHLPMEPCHYKSFLCINPNFSFRPNFNFPLSLSRFFTFAFSLSLAVLHFHMEPCHYKSVPCISPKLFLQTQVQYFTFNFFAFTFSLSLTVLHLLQICVTINLSSASTQTFPSDPISQREKQVQTQLLKRKREKQVELSWTRQAALFSLSLFSLSLFSLSKRKEKSK